MKVCSLRVKPGKGLHLEVSLLQTISPQSPELCPIVTRGGLPGSRLIGRLNIGVSWATNENCCRSAIRQGLLVVEKTTTGYHCYLLNGKYKP